MNNILKEPNLILDIKHTVTTAYRPQSNGTCERLHSTIINRIRILHPRRKPRWNLHLDGLICAYHSTTHESISNNNNNNNNMYLKSSIQTSSIDYI